MVERSLPKADVGSSNLPARLSVEVSKIIMIQVALSSAIGGYHNKTLGGQGVDIGRGIRTIVVHSFLDILASKDAPASSSDGRG